MAYAFLWRTAVCFGIVYDMNLSGMCPYAQAVLRMLVGGGVHLQRQCDLSLSEQGEEEREGGGGMTSL